MGDAWIIDAVRTPRGKGVMPWQKGHVSERRT